MSVINGSQTPVCVVVRACAGTEAAHYEEREIALSINLKKHTQKKTGVSVT